MDLKSILIVIVTSQFKKIVKIGNDIEKREKKNEKKKKLSSDGLINLILGLLVQVDH